MLKRVHASHVVQVLHGQGICYACMQTCEDAAMLNRVLQCRFHKPWRELEDFAMSIDLATADDILHKHTPYGEIWRCWLLKISLTIFVGSENQY